MRESVKAFDSGLQLSFTANQRPARRSGQAYSDLQLLNRRLEFTFTGAMDHGSTTTKALVFLCDSLESLIDLLFGE